MLAVRCLIWLLLLGAQALVTGLIFSKLVRPKSRGQTIVFSKRAVICRRDGEYQLMFRVGDMRRSHMVGSTIRALLVRSRETAEGELIPLCQHTLSVQMESGREKELEGTTQLDSNITFLVWPITVVHHINQSSPLWTLSSESLLDGPRFEIIVILEGTIESTGMLAQVRTSYLAEEISWAERLCPLLTYERENGRYEIDFSQFHRTRPVAMPYCSASQWTESRQHYGSLKKSFNIKQAKSDDEMNESDDYSVSFTLQSAEMLAKCPSSPVWNLFSSRTRLKEPHTVNNNSRSTWILNDAQEHSWTPKSSSERRLSLGSMITHF